MDFAWIGIAATALSVIGVFVKMGFDKGQTQTRIDDLEKRLDKHEPTAVQIATLSTQMTSLQSAILKVETNIDRLFERTNKRGTV
jgi:cell division protein FtsL